MSDVSKTDRPLAEVDGVRALVNECPNLCEFEMNFAGRLEGDTSAFIADMRRRGISTSLR